MYFTCLGQKYTFNALGNAQVNNSFEILKVYFTLICALKYNGI